MGIILMPVFYSCPFIAYVAKKGATELEALIVGFHAGNC